MKTTLFLAGAFLGLLLLSNTGCTRHEIETKSQIAVAPIEVKPIHITIDVNLKVEKELNDVFSDVDQAVQKGAVPHSTGQKEINREK